MKFTFKDYLTTLFPSLFLVLACQKISQITNNSDYGWLLWYFLAFVEINVVSFIYRFQRLSFSVSLKPNKDEKIRE